MSREYESRAQMQQWLDEAWKEIVSLVDSLPADELERPGVVESWSIKDLLGHMAFWADKAARDLRLLADGRSDAIETPADEEETARWNARESARRRGQSLAEAKAEWRSSFDNAKKALATTSEDLLWREVKGWPQAVRFREDTYNHYGEHAEQIRAWQRQLETSET